MRQRDEVLKEAAQASISYSGRVDEAFVLSYLVELTARMRERGRPGKQLLSSGIWALPDSKWVPKDAERLNIPLPEELPLWLNVKTGVDGMAMIPAEKGRVTIVTTGGTTTVPDEPYWLLVRYPALAPILAAYNVAVSRASHSESRNVLVVVHSPLKNGYHYLFASPEGGVNDFFRERGERYHVYEPAPAGIPKERSEMQKHLTAFYGKLVKLYGSMAPNLESREVGMEFLDDPGLIAAIGRN